MTMPSIADVKAAAEEVLCETCPGFGLNADDHEAIRAANQRRRDAQKLVAQFVLSVINTPGLPAERLEEIQRKEQAATPGPWHYNRNDSVPRVRDAQENDVIFPGEWDAMHMESKSNGDFPFIADARQAVPELLAEVLRLLSGVTLPDGGEVG